MIFYRKESRTEMLERRALRKAFLKSFLIFFSVLLIQCSPYPAQAASLFKKASVPYLIVDAFVENGEIAGFSNNGAVTFEIKNCSEKKIQSFLVIFSVVNEDGENAVDDGTTILVRCDEEIEAGESTLVRFKLEGALKEEEEGPFSLEGYYIQQIYFEDNTVWRDPWGKYSMCGRIN